VRRGCRSFLTRSLSGRLIRVTCIARKTFSSRAGWGRFCPGESKYELGRRRITVMSNSDTCAALSPRPWSVSVTLVWQDSDDFYQLRDALWPFLRPGRLPVHHLEVARESWHSTIFAVLQINRVSRDREPFSQFANDIFTRLRRYQSFEEDLRSKLRPLKVVAHEVRCYDDGTTVQFQESSDLEQLRTGLRKFFRRHVSRVVSSTVSAYGTPAVGGMRPIVESLLDDAKKSWGRTLFGSIARSPCRADSLRHSNGLRWIEKIKPKPVTLQCNRFHLLVSDAALTNPRQLNENDLLFPS